MVLPSELRTTARPALHLVDAEPGHGLSPVMFRVGLVEGRPAWAIMLPDAGPEDGDPAADGADEPLTRFVAGTLDTREDLHEFVSTVLAYTPEGAVVRGSYPSQLESVLEQLIPCVHGVPQPVAERLKGQMFVSAHWAEHATEPVYVYADASSGGTRPGLGLGWAVTGTGLRPRFGCRYFGYSTNIMVGEILAMIHGLCAVEALPGVGRVVVRSDSRPALAWMRRHWGGRAPSGLGAAAAEFSTLAFRVKHLDVRFEWVKGHSGDPWNEACDRLALGTRRNHQMGLAHLDALILERVREEMGLIPAA